MPRANKTDARKLLAPPLTASGAFILTNAHGLHARPSAMLVRCASQFRCQITAQIGEGRADAKSILGLLALGAHPQAAITFTATGEDAPQAIAAIQRLFERRFDEAGPANQTNPRPAGAVPVSATPNP